MAVGYQPSAVSKQLVAVMLTVTVTTNLLTESRRLMADGY